MLYQGVSHITYINLELVLKSCLCCCKTSNRNSEGDDGEKCPDGQFSPRIRLKQGEMRASYTCEHFDYVLTSTSKKHKSRPIWWQNSTDCVGAAVSLQRFLLYAIKERKGSPHFREGLKICLLCRGSVAHPNFRAKRQSRISFAKSPENTYFLWFRLKISCFVMILQGLNAKKTLQNCFCKVNFIFCCVPVFISGSVAHHLY